MPLHRRHSHVQSAERVPIPSMPEDFILESEFCSAHGADLIGDGDRGWVVCDNLTGAVLGCVDPVGHHFELMEVWNEFHWTTFPSLQAALERLLGSRESHAGTARHEQRRIV